MTIENTLLLATALLVGAVFCWILLAVPPGPQGRNFLRGAARAAASDHNVCWEKLNTEEFIAGYNAGLWFVCMSGASAQAVIECYEIALKRMRLQRDDYELGWTLAVRPHYLSVRGWQSDLFGNQRPQWYAFVRSVFIRSFAIDRNHHAETPAALFSAPSEARLDGKP